MNTMNRNTLGRYVGRSMGRYARLAVAMAALPLAGCAGPQIGDHVGDPSTFDFKQYFDGTVMGHGLINDVAARCCAASSSRCAASGPATKAR